MKVVNAVEAAKAQWRETDERAADSGAAVPIRFSSNEEAGTDELIGEVITETKVAARYEEAKLSVRR
jgi:hypothetical protein